jgi:hypothetical protein
MLLLRENCHVKNTAKRLPTPQFAARIENDMAIRIQTVTIDTADPGPIARWWANALGWRVTYEADDEFVIEPPSGSPADGVSPDLLFIKVPDDKIVKNRIHLDLRPDDQAAEVARFESIGARRIDIGQGSEVTWVVMADPDGNEFCSLRALRPEEIPGSVPAAPND